MRLTIEKVGKVYKGAPSKAALSDFSLDLGPGVIGLLGPNGAGKSTLMRILATVTPPTTGRVLWHGEDTAKSPTALRASLGYLPQDFGIYPNLRDRVPGVPGGGQGGARPGRPAADRRASHPGQPDRGRQGPLGGYSGGMRQRVGIAQALLSDPRLLIVDGPTVGLDPEERVRFRNLLSDLSGDRIVILSTHIVSDVEAAAAREEAAGGVLTWQLSGGTGELPVLNTRCRW
jgi:ABC-2 type transport system ATP-binding protein